MSKEIKRRVIPGVRYINLDKVRVEYLKETFADNMKAMLSEYKEQSGQSGFLSHGEIFLITTEFAERNGFDYEIEINVGDYNSGKHIETKLFHNPTVEKGIGKIFEATKAATIMLQNSPSKAKKTINACFTYD